MSSSAYSDVRLGSLYFKSSTDWRSAAADSPHRMLKCTFCLRKWSSQPLLAEKFSISSRDAISLSFSCKSEPLTRMFFSRQHRQKSNTLSLSSSCEVLRILFLSALQLFFHASVIAALLLLMFKTVDFEMPKSSASFLQLYPLLRRSRTSFFFSNVSSTNLHLPMMKTSLLSSTVSLQMPTQYCRKFKQQYCNHRHPHHTSNTAWSSRYCT
jgi:hypothetical protein